ncbi:MAG TPA: hypothetical protein VF317_06325 [Dermatophilaceae bacterium]
MEGAAAAGGCDGVEPDVQGVPADVQSPERVNASRSRARASSSARLWCGRSIRARVDRHRVASPIPNPAATAEAEAISVATSCTAASWRPHLVVGRERERGLPEHEHRPAVRTVHQAGRRANRDGVSGQRRQHRLAHPTHPVPPPKHRTTSQ